MTGIGGDPVHGQSSDYTGCGQEAQTGRFCASGNAEKLMVKLQSSASALEGAFIVGFFPGSRRRTIRS
jgi:hypothetical protein